MPDKALVAQLEHYLHENLNAALSLVPWADVGHLPGARRKRFVALERIPTERVCVSHGP